MVGDAEMRGVGESEGVISIEGVWLEEEFLSNSPRPEKESIARRPRIMKVRVTSGWR